MGVIDVPYKNGGKTTGDVAEILEAKYHIMELFFQEHSDDVISTLVKSYADALADLIGGAPPASPSQDGTNDIRTMFNRFIDARQLDGIEPGVPTQASLDGVNHSFKHPYAKGNPTRPSFRDTGQYRDSFFADIVA